jgi:hypothetical protein
MVQTLLEAKAQLEAEGLYVAWNIPNALWIAGTLTQKGEGIQLSPDACSLLRDGERWVAIFPAEGLRTYEREGPLPELVSLIVTVYQHYRRSGRAFSEAFPRSVRNPEQYLVGRSLSRV